MPTPKEIEAAADRAADAAMKADEEGSKYPGMNYEQGLREALDWVCGNIDDDPTRDL